MRRECGRRTGVVAGLGLLVVLLAPRPASAQNEVPAEFQGTWIPVKATCGSGPRVVVTGKALTLFNGSDTESLGGIEMAGPGYFPPDYSGIMAVLITEFDGQQPAMMFFNYKEKKGAGEIEFSPPVKPAPGNAQGAAYNARVTKLSLATRFPVEKQLLKKCAGDAGGAPAPTGGKPATVVAPVSAAPSACAGLGHCTEVAPFAMAVTDFRTSTAGGFRVVTINARFKNRGTAPLILGYVQGSGIVTDDQGNRYAVNGEGALRGIGQITGNTFDSKFTLQGGESADARFEFSWWPKQGQIFGTMYSVELTVREIDALPGNQFRLGREYVLKLDGFGSASQMAAGSPPPKVTPVSAGPSGAGQPATTSAPPAEVPDACGGKKGCYGAGPFVAEITQVNTSHGSGYNVVHLNVKVRNVSDQPLILAYQAGSGSATDDAGNRLYAKDNNVKGIGFVTKNAADPQFTLSPGQTRSLALDYQFYVTRNTVVGTSWTADFVLEQLEILASKQVRSVREFSVSFPGLTSENGYGANPGAPTSATSSSSVGKTIGKLFHK